MSKLQIFLLGAPYLDCDAAPMKLARRKNMALLAYLAVTAQPCSRETVTTLLWPDFDAPNAYAYLRNALWMIKQTPVAHWMEIGQDTLTLRADETLWVDVTRFTTVLAARNAHRHPAAATCKACIPLLQEAVALYRGDFMAGFTLGDSAAFDEWQCFQTESLRQAMSNALEKLTMWYIEDGPPEMALDYAQRWQSHDPLHEGAKRQLMMLYAHQNQRAAALHLYDTLLCDLRAQGLTPADETVALYRRIRAGDAPTDEPPARAGQTAVAPPLPAGIVTFLFTDIEGSVAMWDQHPQAMQTAIAQHHTLLRRGIEANGGCVFKIVGDAFQAAFALPSQALAASIAIQRILRRTDWSVVGALRVRMGLHSGPAEPAPDAMPEDYAVSHTLNRVARIMSAGHGGQILLSHDTVNLLHHELPPGVTLKDLGDHRLKGLAEPMRLYQVIAADLPQDFPPLATAVAPLHNLPAPITTFVGRATELSELHRQLADPAIHLITLVGPGGVGKTRLALRLAEESRDNFPDGVFFVPLTTVETLELLLSAVADVLGVVLYQQNHAEPLAQLAQYLRDKSMLLVLDNLEQALPDAAHFASILAQTPTVKLVVTSRERLNVQGEWTLELRGLHYPEAECVTEVAGYSAVQLFIARAQQSQPRIAADGDELAAIIRICRLVEGMPLGLELAAAWVKLLSCNEIAEEIARSLDFLTLTARDMPERHRSLRVVFDHSWNLLSPEERTCYCTLAAFRGGFTRAAATEIAGASLPLLATLLDKSMLTRTAAGRYEILEVLRQYAWEHLQATSEHGDAIRDQHSTYYLALLHRLEPALKGPGREAAFGQLGALNTIQADIENIRAAWQWAIARRDVTALHRAAFSLGLFCDIRSRFREALTLFREAAIAFDSPESAAPPEFLGLLLGILGEHLMRLSQNDCQSALRRGIQLLDGGKPGPELALVNVLSSYGESWHTAEEMAQRLNAGLALYEAQHDLWGIALALDIIAMNLDLSQRGDLDAAQRHASQALALRRQIDDHWGIAISLFTLAAVAEAQGALPEARRSFEGSMVMRQTLQDMYGAAHCAHHVGRISFRMGELEKAQQLQWQALTMLREIGASHGVSDALQTLAEIAQAQGDLSSAQTYLSETRALHRETGKTVLEPAKAEDIDAFPKGYKAGNT